MQKILVTGGLGFIGSNLTRMLLDKNYYVINIDKVSYASNFYNVKDVSNNKNYKFIRTDIANKKRIKKILNYFKPKCIFNQVVFLILQQRPMLIDLLIVQKIL